MSNDKDKISPFLLEKWFEGVSRQITNVKRQRDGSYLVDCPTKKIASCLLARDKKTHIFGSATFAISVTAHASLNSSRGVVRSYHFEGLSEGEIKEGLSTQGVTNAHRVLRTNKDGKKVPTNTIFLTFCTPVLPTRVKIMYESIPVSAFVPSPLRCFRCQRYGHGSRTCKNSSVCSRCGETAHEEGVQCVGEPHCSNCKGDHPASSKSCPIWIKETEIQRIKTAEGCSFPDARKRYEMLHPVDGTSYASVTGTLIAPSKSKPVETATPAKSTLEELIVGLTAAIHALTKRVESLEGVVQARPGMDPVPTVFQFHKTVVADNTLRTVTKASTSNTQTAVSKAVKNNTQTAVSTAANTNAQTTASNVVTPKDPGKQTSRGRASSPKPTVPPRPVPPKPGPASSKVKTANRFTVLEVEMEDRDGPGSCPESRSLPVSPMN
jgi:hypothetical protein